MGRSLPRPRREPDAAPSGSGESDTAGRARKDQRLAVARRRGAVAAAGFSGDEELAREAFEDPEPTVRAAALGALVRLGAASAEDARRATSDPHPDVRRVACELAVDLSGGEFLSLLIDGEPEVVEAAAFAVGELGALDAVPALIEIARHHDDPLCRESAVAALGAIGDPSGMQAVLAALEDIPAIRRRAVVALAAFEGPEVEAALRGRLEDRDWQVRQAAEELLAAGEQG